MTFWFPTISDTFILAAVHVVQRVVHDLHANDLVNVGVLEAVKGKVATKELSYHNKASIINKRKILNKHNINIFFQLYEILTFHLL